MILPLTLEHTLRVALVMRAEDRREIFATRHRDDAAELARLAVALSRFGAIAATALDRPVAALGAIEAWPGVFQVWMFATDDWPKVALEATRWCCRVLRPAMLAAGGHRAECASLDGHRQAQRWLERLGFRREATMPAFGRHGETFHRYVMTRETT